MSQHLEAYQDYVESDDDDSSSDGYEETYLEVSKKDGEYILIPLNWLDQVMTICSQKILVAESDTMH